MISTVERFHECEFILVRRQLAITAAHSCRFEVKILYLSALRYVNRAISSNISKGTHCISKYETAKTK